MEFFCKIDKECSNKVPCNVDTFYDGSCKNICYPFGVTEVGSCSPSDINRDGY